MPDYALDKGTLAGILDAMHGLFCTARHADGDVCAWAAKFIDFLKEYTDPDTGELKYVEQLVRTVCR
jgi:hypothetical protein